MNDFKYTACDNFTCKDSSTCKRFIMWRDYQAEDVKKGGGNADKHCKKYLHFPLLSPCEMVDKEGLVHCG